MVGFVSWVLVLGTAEPVESHTVQLFRNYGRLATVGVSFTPLVSLTGMVRLRIDTRQR